MHQTKPLSTHAIDTRHRIGITSMTLGSASPTTAIPIWPNAHSADDHNTALLHVGQHATEGAANSTLGNTRDAPTSHEPATTTRVGVPETRECREQTPVLACVQAHRSGSWAARRPLQPNPPTQTGRIPDKAETAPNPAEDESGSRFGFCPLLWVCTSAMGLRPCLHVAYQLTSHHPPFLIGP